MAIAPRNSRRSSIDIWPGFVDALAQLLMVIIFILLVFTAGQFYLSEALSGRDQALQRLQQQVNELGDLLAMERRATADLRVNAADLSAQLASSQAERDRLTGQLRDADATVSADKDKIELQLREIESLRRDLDALKSVRPDLEAKIAALAQQQAQVIERKAPPVILDEQAANARVHRDRRHTVNMSEPTARCHARPHIAIK